MIRFEQVTKVYSKEQIALRNISIEIKKGEFVFLVGPSGAGKSTFMKLIFREELANEGKIFIEDKIINDILHKEVSYLRRKLGIVFQDVRLLPNKTVYENIAFAMIVTEANDRRQIKRRVKQIVEMVGLQDRIKAFPRELSGGEQQRVAIARAIVNRPSIVIADEPTGNLDPETSRGIIQNFDKINNDGTTVIMATHDKNIVDEMKKRVIAIENGIIVRDEIEGMYGYEN